MPDELETFKDQVEYCLREFPQTRDSDKLLTWKIWEVFHYVRERITFEKFMELPTEDAVKRIRAHFQNVLKRYPPTSREVALQRNWKEDEWLTALGYKPGDQMAMF
jgi:hypothetical protein